MFGKRHKDNGEKVFRYSIRKYHFGAASVAIAALIFFANGVAQAETLPVRPETANVQSSPEGELSDSGGRAVSEVQPAEQPKVLTQSVNKDALRIAIGNLSDVVRKVESSKLVALESQLTQVVEESKRLLEDGGATEQAVATEVETINSLIREVEKLLPKSEPTVDEPADKKDKEASIEHPKDEKKVVSDQEKSKKDLSIVDKAKLNEDKAAVNQGSEDRLTSNPNKVAKKELPTYSNENDGATNLSNELYFIYGELKKANTDTSKIQEVKDAYDRINNAIPLANNGVVNQAIFDAALVDLKKARELIESVLNGKTTDNSTTTPVNPQPRSSDEELPSRGRGRTRTTRTVREGTENYANSLESFFEDGKKGNSPYDKYTYIFYSRRQVNILDKANRRVDESRNQIYADVTPTNSGFKWDIYINRSKYDLSDAVGWFTIPSGQDVIPGTTVMSWSGADGNHASAPNDGTVSGALREAGFRNVTEGTPQNSGVNKAGNSTVNKKYTSSSLHSLTHNGGITGQNPYKKNLESPDEQKLAEDKFDIIERSNGKLFYFELNNDLKTYHLSFETRGSNNINNLAYAVGMKGERTDDDNPQLRARFLVNQWYARVPREVDDTDRFKFKVSGNGYFKIDQNTVNPIFAPGNNDYKQTRDGIIYRNHYDYANKPLDPNTNGVLTYNASGNLTDYRNIDFTSYGEYFNESGTIIPKEGGGKSGAASRGQNFQFIKDENGATRTLSREEVTLDAVRTPGVHTYRYNRSFNDGSHDTGKFSFVTKPKTPTLTTDLARQAGKTINIQANNGTNGYEMRLYKRVANGSLTEVLGANGKPLTATAGANGVATFTNVKVEEADYVVKTVVEGKWVDYDNTRHSTVESDESNIKTATDGVPPVVVVSVNGTPLPTSKNDVNPVLYEVTQGGRFNPTIKVWDNSGKINSLSIANTPAGVNKEKFRQDFRNQTTATEATPYTAPTLEGTVANNQTPGIHIAEISTSDANGNSQTYYFNYKVKPTAPVVTGTTTGDRVLSTDRSLSGTATAGAKIKVIVADRTVADNITVGSDGRWTVTLPTGLNSNDTGQDQLVAKDPVRVIQTVNNVESSATTVTVAVGGAQVQPTVAGGTSVYAGAKTITVNAPHDSGMFYVKYREKDSNTEKEIGIKRDSITGPWTSIKPELGVVTGTTTRDGFVDSVTIEMKKSIKEGSVSAIANIKQGLYSSPRGWQITPVTDDAPTLTPSFQGDKKVVEAGSTLNLTDLVRASDKEDSPGLTRGNGTQVEVVSVNGNTGNKTINTNQVGRYTVRLKATDSQGKVSPEKDVTVEVKPTAPVVTGTTTGDRVLSTDRSLSGTATAGAKIKVIVADRTVADNITVGSDGRWTVTLPTGLNSNDTGQDQLVAKDPVRVIQTVNNVESSATTVTVAVGGAQVQPTVAGGTSVYAGAKTITVNAPHDSGMFYVKYREKDSNTEKEIGIKRDSITGPWTSIKPELGVVTGTTTRDGFVDSVTIEMKKSIKEGSVSAIANIKQGLYSSPRGWQITPVTDDAPTLTPSFQGDKKVVEAGSTLNLTDLVRASDKEDSPGLTRGNGTQVEVVSVNGNTGNKTINTNQVGRYTVRLKATDSQGKVSPEKDVTVEVKPTAPVVTGTTTGDRVLSTDRSLSGTATAGAKIKVIVADRTVADNITVGSDGRWTVTLPTGLNSNDTGQDQLVAKDPVRVIQTVNNVESSATTVTVAVGGAQVQPTVAGGTSVYAGAKTITVNAPHDSGMFYVKYREKDSNTEKEIGIKRDSITGPWTSIKPELGVVTGTTTRDGFVDSVTIEMKKSIKEGSVSAIANIKQGLYSSPRGWQITPVTDDAPTLTPSFQGDKKVVEAGSTLNLTDLVRASDKEDSPGLTRGNGTQVEVVSVNGNTGNKTINTNQVGRYTVRLKATDSQGKVSPEKDVTVEVKPTAPVVTGTTTGDRVLSTDRSLSGTATAGAKIKVIVADRTVADNITVGSDGRWTVTLPTGLNSNDTGQDQLVAKDPVRVIQTVNNVESSATTVTVAVGGAQVQPTVAGGTSVYAGAKTITVNAPHDSGMFYVKYREKDSNTEKEIGIKRDSITGPWTSIKPELGVVTGTTTRDGFVDSVTIEMKKSIKEGSVSAIANIKQGLYSSPRGWQITPVTDDAPTLTPSFQGDKKVVEAGSTLNLTDLVRASDKEDSPGLTRGNGTQVEVVSVNGNTGNKTINTNQVGRYTVRLKATDSQGKVSPEKDVTVEVTDTTAPDAPVINTPLAGKANTTTPIEVTAEPGSTVVLTAGGKEIGRGTAGANGKVTITPTENIPVGDVTATATDASNNKSGASAAATATDTTAPDAPVINTPLAGKANTTTPIEVTAEPGSTVVLTAGGKEIGRGTAGANGKVTITPTENIPVGDVTATATDASNNKSGASAAATATDTTAPDAPVINTPLAGKANTTTPIEVTAEPGSTVVLTAGGKEIGRGTAGANGKVTITPTENIPVGDVTATATDASNNKSGASAAATATDTTAPDAPVINTPLAGKANTTTPIEVTAEPGSTVVLTAGGKEIGRGTAGANGKVTITPTENIPVGDVTATATDASNNKSGASAAATATDTTAPDAPVINTPLAGKANTTTPIEVTAEPGSTVVLTAGGKEIGRGTAGANGKVTITPTENIPVGDVTATATDASNNKSGASAAATATDTTAPDAPVINTPLAGKANTTTPIEVTAEPGSTVVLTAGGKEIGRGTAGANGKVTITPTENIPVGDVTATATDASNNKSGASAAATATDTTAPDAPVINTPLAGKANTTTPIEVTAEPGSTVVLTAGGKEIGRGTAGANGKVTITPTENIPVGDVTATATDASNNKSGASAAATATDTTAPDAPVINTPLAGKANTTTPIEVTAEPGSTVVLTAGGKEIGRGTAGANGKVTITPTENIPVGDVTATATDASNNKSGASAAATATDTTAPDAPVINTPLAGKANTTTPIEVTAEPGSTVVLTAGGKEIGRGTAGANGKVTITPTENIPVGDVTATATDASNNKSGASAAATATDTTAPDAPVINTPLAGKANTTTPIEVTAEPGSTVVLTAGGKEIGRGTAGANGKVTITPTENIPVGDVTATATDASNNKSGASAAATATDTTAPDAPVINTPLAGKANTTTPIEVTAEPGSTVVLTAGGKEIGRGTAGANGKVTITPTENIPVGDVTATATDASNNKSGASAAATATDTTAPDAPVINTPLAGKANTTTPIEVTAEPGSTVVLTAGGKEIGRGTAGANGKVTITPTENIPVGDVTATATDASNNKSGASAAATATDTTAPDAPVINTPLAGKANTTTPIEVTAEPGSTVVLTAGGKEIGRGTAGANGKVTITPTENIPVGDVTATATDASNNKSGASAAATATDTTAPDAPVINTPLAGKANTTTPIEVTAEPGSTVVLTAGGKEIGRGTAGANGKVTITPTENIPVGDVTATATDASNNKSGASAAATATDTTAPDAPVINTPLAGKANTTTPIEVTAEPGSTVVLTAGGKEIGRGTAGANGKVTITPTENIPVGDVTATATDASNNKSGASAAATATDTTAPDAPVINTPLAGKANTTTPIEVTAEPGSTVVLTAGGKEIGRGTAGANGKVTITPTENIPVGDVTATATDASNNKSGASAAATATDTTAPDAPVINTPLAGKANTTTPIEVTAEPGSTVVLTAGGKEIGRGTAGANGKVTITPTENIPVGDVTATATDASNNKSGASAAATATDTTAPDAPVINTPLAGKANTTTPIEVTAEPGSTVVLTAGGKEIGRGTAGANGKVTITPTENIPVGDVTATATDASNNKSGASAAATATDTTAPDAPVINTPLAGKANTTTPIEVTAEPGSTVVLTAGGKEIGRGTAGANGKVTITPTENIPVGDVTATATDASNNKSGASAAATATDTTAPDAPVINTPLAGKANTTTPIEVTAEPGSTVVLTAGGKEIGRGTAGANGKVTITPTENIPVGDVTATATDASNNKSGASAAATATDTTAPDAPVINTPLAGKANTTTPIEVTAEPGSTVVLTAGGKEIGRGTAGANGKVTITPTENIPVGDVTATATDASNNKSGASAAATATDTTAPDAPVINTPLAGKANTTTPIEVTAEPGSTVVLTAGGKEIGRGTAGANGKVTITPTENIPVGDVTATATDASNNKSGASAAATATDTTAPDAPVINTPLAGKANTTTPIEVTAEPGSTVVLTAGGKEIGRGTAGANGKVTITPTENIPVGDVTATATDASNNKSGASAAATATDTTAPDAPVINTPLAGKANTTTPIEVTAEPGSTVVLTAGGKEIGRGTAGANGKVTITPTENIPVGDVTATATDASNNKSGASAAATATDTTAPDAPVINTPLAGKANTTTPIEVTAEPGSTVVLTAGGKEIGRGTAGANGKVTITPTENIPVGDVTATATDASNNKSGASAAATATDTTAPDAPVINTPLAGKANTTTPIEVTAEPGSTVVLTAGGKEIGRGTAGANGKVTITPTENIPVGDVTATATDASNNKSGASAAATATDTTAPDAPVINTPLAGKANTTTPIEVTAEPGSTVVLTAGGKEIGRGTAGANGKVTITPTENIPVGDVTATATDASNNKSGASAAATATDTTAPDAPVINTPLAGKANTTTPIEVTAEPGSTVVLTAGGKEIGRGTAGANGKVTITPTENIPVGDVTATATDASNNKSGASAAATATDTTAPDAPVINTPLAGKANTTTPIEVTAEPGSTVVLTAGGKEIGRGTAGANGKVTITPTENIPVGDVTATATDASNNKSGASAAATATDTTAPDAPVINTPLAGKANTTTPIEVTAEPGSTVVLTAGGKEIGRGTAGANGKVTITPTENIPVGDVTATATDASNNKSGASAAATATDTTAPDAPVINTPLAGKANTTTPIEVTAEPGSTVVLTAGGKEIGRGTAGANGKVTITPTENIPVGDVTATATDASNNKSGASAAATATDTTAPDAPVINTPLAGKANTTTPIEVTAEPGSTVVLTAGGKEIGRGTAGANGKVTITPTENIPVGDVTATATDASGNKSTPSEVKPATDTTAPEKPVIDTGDGQQRPATPSDDTNPRPDTVTPAEVPAVQSAEQPSQTVEVPAQLPNEVSETDSSVSQPQAVLPNTGTQEDRATGAFGVLSLLGAFGLLFAKKKKDDEEEA